MSRFESSACCCLGPAGGFRADYGFIATMDRQVRRDPERYVGYGITDSWDEIRQLLAGGVIMLFRDRRTHAHTRQLMETEAGMSREAWRRAMDSSDLAHGGVISLRTTVYAQMEEITELQSADRGGQLLPYRAAGTRLEWSCTAGAARGRLKMAPKRATRATRATTTPAPTATTTTNVTNAQLQTMINQGVSAALAADFMKCKPLYFKGTEGVVELTQWFERMETVFRISNCSAENQIKFATCTLLAGALTWWNTHVMTVTHDVAYSMTWVNLKKKMTDKYCPRNEMKKLEAELWNLKVIGTDVVKYNQRFQELALLCVRMFPEEADKIERYVGGIATTEPWNIGGIKAKYNARGFEMATELYGTCESVRNVNNNNNQKGTGSGQKPTCFECGAQGHFKKECPRLKNNKGNRGNQAGNDRAPAKVYVVGNAGANPDNVVAGTFLLNNRDAYILFDTGADRSFVSTAFSSQIDITPSTLDHYYDVGTCDAEDRRIFWVFKHITLRVAH
ncbi:reverse transcriptase domain-containing protein [Tanacetum coccineum]